jgi:type I restriction enzyme S subunit
LLVLRPGEVTAEFLRYVLLSDWFVKLVDSSTFGVKMPRADWEFIGNVMVPIPPLAVQREIATFLERKTSAIDDLIKKKEKLVELLQEKRQALITQVVTKGLDPKAPMKESGIPSIGLVPSHWQVTQLKRRWRVIDCKHRTPSYLDEGFPLVSTTEVKPGRLDLSRVERRVGEADYLDLTDGRRPKRGDIIYSRNASLGAAAYVDTEEKFCMGQDVVLIASGDQDQLFLTYLLNSRVVTSQVEQACIGSTFKRINVPDIERLVVPIPTPREQRTIAADLDVRVGTLDVIVEAVLSSIQQLCDYRQALISAAVTGQLDLSKEAA